MKQQQITHALNQISEQAVPDTLNLWPAIQTRLPNRRPQPSAVYPLRRLATVAAIALAAIVVIMAVPPLHALAQQIIDSLFIASTGSEQMTQTYTVDIQPTPTFAVIPQPSGLAEVEAQAGFDVHEPALPAGYVFDSANYYAEGQAVYHNYHFGDQWGSRNLVIQQQPLSALEALEVGPNAVVETVQIGAFTGEYLTGWWDSEVALTPIEGSSQAVVEVESTWNPNIAMQWLRWQDGETAYQIMFQSATLPSSEYYNGGDTTSPGYLTKDDLVAIAASLR
jgi:hypothetical protein